MEKKYAGFTKLMSSKLTTKSISLAVVNEQGAVHYENFKQGTNKQEILEVANQTIATAKNTAFNLEGEFPEYMMYKGTDAFLLILPSKLDSHYYVVFCHNGLNVGMTRICVQNTIEAFEKENQQKN